MRKTVISFALCVLLAALCASAEAQQPTKVPRIGFLSITSPSTISARVDAFRQGLRDLGYIEGKNILVEYRYAEGRDDLLLSHVAELVQIKVDVIVITSLPQIRAAKQATKTIPIVMVTTVDPVATGLIESLARPGGNITGLTRLTRDLSGKRLELLKEAVPRISRVAVLMSRYGWRGGETTTLLEVPVKVGVSLSFSGKCQKDVRQAIKEEKVVQLQK